MTVSPGNELKKESRLELIALTTRWKTSLEPLSLYKLLPMSSRLNWQPITYSCTQTVQQTSSVRSTPVWTLSLAHSQDSLSSLSQVIKVKLSTKGYYTPRLPVVWWLYGTNWKVSSGLHVYSSLNGISEHLWTKSYMDLWLNLSSIHGYRLSVQVATLPALLTQ